MLLEAVLSMLFLDDIQQPTKSQPIIFGQPMLFVVPDTPSDWQPSMCEDGCTYITRLLYIIAIDVYYDQKTYI